MSRVVLPSIISRPQTPKRVAHNVDFGYTVCGLVPLDSLPQCIATAWRIAAIRGAAPRRVPARTDGVMPISGWANGEHIVRIGVGPKGAEPGIAVLKLFLLMIGGCDARIKARGFYQGAHAWQDQPDRSDRRPPARPTAM